jgi:quercetin 2,3-dioxygenase
MTAQTEKTIHTNTLKEIEIKAVTQGQQAMDGDGVRLTRMIGTNELNMLDPFLLLDVFESDNPDDYIGGFPEHPHRGFETVTYLLDGKMRHKDSVGTNGVIEPGGVQWMTAAKGIVHSEMPEQVDGLLKGFQLWVNLPASEKMKEPSYQEFPADQVAVEQWASGSHIRVIAGQTNQGTVGPVINEHTQPTYMDITLAKNDVLNQTISTEHNAFIYVIEGNVSIGSQQYPLTAGKLAVLSEGNALTVTNNNEDESRFILVSGKPIKEPVVRGGPFVMNTEQEIRQAFHDFQTGNFL